jgi:hypothetical protein
MDSTPLENKTAILSELWLNYRDEAEFQDFIEYNDLGLPLAYAINAHIVEATEIADKFISETFDLLLAGLGMEDEGFETLDDILGA